MSSASPETVSPAPPHLVQPGAPCLAASHAGRRRGRPRPGAISLADTKGKFNQQDTKGRFKQGKFNQE
eukprot:2384910-Prymnesium_polylepis.1